MSKMDIAPYEEAKNAALEVLLHNRKGPYQGLPRTAGWGYPEPYTRDLMIASLGILATGNELLIASLKANNSLTRSRICPCKIHFRYFGAHTRW